MGLDIIRPWLAASIRALLLLELLLVAVPVALDAHLPLYRRLGALAVVILTAVIGRTFILWRR